jgi:hypothetical protein
MNKFYLLFIAILLSIEVSSQRIENGWKKTPEDRKESRKIGNNIYFSAGFTPIFSIYKYRYKYFYEDGLNLVEELSDPQKSHARIELEVNIRYNLFNFRDFFSISATFLPAISFHNGGIGTVYWNKPVSLDLNFYNHSTFNNINNLGFSISGGVQNHKIDVKSSPLFHTIQDLKWRDYFGRISIKFRKYKSTQSIKFNPRKYYYSYFALQYGFSNQTISINTGETTTDKFTHFKIVFGKIFRY